tara:strand:+ start:10126 stop:11643 length:1518 start_codon:yes stop_codon:yes gene_type:complete
MAVYKLFPSKDASIYSAYPAMNTGLDAILDVSNLVVDTNPTAQVARSLIKFDQGEINDVLENIAKVTGSAAWGTWDAHLKMYVAKATNVIIDSEVEVYPVSSSWNNGSGQYLDKIQNFTGVSWKYEDFSGSADVWPAGGWNPSSTGSYDKNWDLNTAIKNGTGGSWYTGSSGFVRVADELVITASQAYTLRSTKDLDVDVSDMVTMWYSSSGAVNIAGLVSKENDGFLVKWADAQEFVTESAVSPQLSYYSVDTNTIYPPQLEIRWVDFNYATSSGDFKYGRILTGSYPTNLTSSISCSFTQSLPTPTANTGTGAGATFTATFNSSSMVNVSVKELGLGYKAGDQLTWNAAALNGLPAITGATTDAVVTISTFDIQQLDVIDTPDIYCALDNNAGVFYSESINQFRLNVRPEFPARTFKTGSLDTKQHALTSASYYAIKDLDTNEFVVEFDKTYTQISCDATSSFFTVYMNGLEPERYYSILVQTEVDGNTVVLDENYYFKVING